jgi:hypothetical protein
MTIFTRLLALFPPQPNRLRAFLGGGFLAACLGALAFIWLYPGFFRCVFVDWQGLDQVVPRLYVNPEMSPAERAVLLHVRARARERVREFFGTLASDPVIIAGNNLAVIQEFGGARAQTGMTHLSPLGGYIVLEERGLNTDVLAHEMAHAELLARVGWYCRTFEVPTWFDEGLAMLVDHRFPEAEHEWARLTASGTQAPPLAQLNTPAGFFGNPAKVYLHYLTAKHEVAQWYAPRGRAGLLALIAGLRAGRPFAECYGEGPPTAPEH